MSNLFSVSKSKARRAELENQNRLDSFKQGIVEGAHEQIGRHLYRAGVYQASLDNDLTRNPDASDVFSSLSRRLSDDDPDMYRFYQENKRIVEQQMNSVDHEGLLRGVLRQKEKASGLLEGNVLRELNQAKILMERMKRLDEYLASWRESLRMEATVEISKVVDMHP